MNNSLKGIFSITINGVKIKIEGDVDGSKDELHEKWEKLLQDSNNSR